MRSVLASTVAAALSLALAGMAAAQAPPPRGAEDTTKSPQTSSPAGTSTTPHPSTTPKAGTSAATNGAMRANQRVTGEVTKIDHSKGMISLKTDEGSMDLHFPPSALQGIKQGDRVEVQMDLRPASASGKAGPSATPGKSKTTSPNPLSGAGNPPPKQP